MQSYWSLPDSSTVARDTIHIDGVALDDDGNLLRERCVAVLRRGLDRTGAAIPSQGLPA